MTTLFIANDETGRAFYRTTATKAYRWCIVDRHLAPFGDRTVIREYVRWSSLATPSLAPTERIFPARDASEAEAKVYKLERALQNKLAKIVVYKQSAGWGVHGETYAGNYTDKQGTRADFDTRDAAYTFAVAAGIRLGVPVDGDKA